MGTYTIPLKRVIELTGDKIGLDDYPIFDEAYREKLNEKIKRHYYMREMGHETIDLFVYHMKTKMHEIMPLYNEHYKLGLLTVDPLSTMSVKSITESDATANTTTSSESTSGSNGKSRAVVSETPQTELSEDQDYATSLQDNISDTSATGTTADVQDVTQNGTNENNLSGYQGHAPLLILQARQALVNVDMMVIDELKELFMLVWQNEDEFHDYNSYGGYRRYGFY